MKSPSPSPPRPCVSSRLLVSAVLALAGCGGSGGSGSATPPIAASATPGPVSATPGPSQASKTALEGLVSMGASDFVDTPGAVPSNAMEEIAAHPAVYAGAVIDATWAELEPSQGVFDDSAIQGGLATIAAYNAQYPATPVRAKLRVFAGQHVPAWLAAVAGGPITISGSKGSEQIDAFWSSGYIGAWRALQTHLAGVYDTSGALAEVAISSCSSLTAEPFVVALDSTSLSAMQRFGFSDAAYMACLSGAPADYAPWKTTPLDYTFNGYRTSDGGNLRADPSFTTSVMQSFRAALGARAVIANHGLQNPLATGAQPIYDEISTLGPPIEFQSVSPTVDWPSTFTLGLTYHPTEVEIWDTIAAGGQANLSQSQLQQFASELP